MNHMSRRLAITLVVTQIFLVVLLILHAVLDLLNHCITEQAFC